MATIALYSNQIAQMSGKLGEVKKTVGDYKSELFSLKTKALAIKQSICNMEDVISSIQASTSVQEEKVDSLEQIRGSSEQFIEDTYRIDGNVAELVNKRKDDFYDQYKYLKPDCEKNGWEKFKDGLKKAGEWCKEHWKIIVTVVLVIAAIIVIAITLFTTVVLPGLLVAMAIEALIGAAVGGVIGGGFSRISGGSFWEGFKDGAFYGAIGGAIGGAMSFVFTGVVWGTVLTLKQLLLIGGVSAIGSVWVGDLGDIVLKGVKMSLKEIVIDVVIAGVTGVAFAGIFYGLSKAFAALKLKIFNKGASKTVKSVDDVVFNQSSLDKAFTKHSGDFGNYADGSKASVNQFKNDVSQLIETGTQKAGTWKGVQGTHIYNQSTQQWAFINADGSFNTAFKLSLQQYEHLIKTGVVK